MNIARSWSPADAFILAALAALAVAATAPIWAEIFAIAARDDEQSHILLALPVAAWLAYLRRERLCLCGPRWTLLGPAVIAAGWAASWYGSWNGVEVARHSGALAVVLGAVLTIVGPRTFRQFLPAVTALLFLVPVPGLLRQEIALPLQESSARVAEFGLQLFGVPAARSGNVLLVNGQPVAVAEACNGMRMVAALGLVTFAFAYSVPMRNTVRLFVLALSPLVALIVNVLRLVPTALMYGYSTPTAADLFHALSGWGVLLVALALLWAVLAMLRWLEVPLAPYGVQE